MDAKGIIDVVVNNSPYLLIILSAAVIFLFTMVISQSLRLSRMQKRYKKMMTGVDDSANLETMLLSHID